MNPHSIKFTDEDWAIIKALAKRLDITPGAFVSLACAQLVRKMGADWQGGKAWGRPRTNPDLQLERAELKMRGLPPLIDDLLPLDDDEGA